MTIVRERVFVLIPKSDYDGFSEADQCHILNRTTNREVENLSIKIFQEADHYLFESERELALGSKLSDYTFHMKDQILIKLGVSVFPDRDSLSFENIGNKTVHITRDSGAFDIQGAWSLCFWIKSAEFVGTGDIYLAELGGNGYLYYDRTSTRLRARVINSISSPFITANGTSLSDNTWHQIIFDYDGVNTINATVDNGTPVLMTSSFTFDTETFATWKIMERSGFGVNFDSISDEWCIVNKVLSAEGKTRIYNDGKAVGLVNMFGTGLKHWWRADNNYVDLGTLGYNGTYQNNPSIVEDIP